MSEDGKQPTYEKRSYSPQTEATQQSNSDQSAQQDRGEGQDGDKEQNQGGKK